ncbi:MAG: PEP-CTERM sorting domain-containing protein [Vicinamibacterales bacterium]|nr:PEP-CTERM sorting domain-containing protein [Vicinamibacterales bacterium]
MEFRRWLSLLAVLPVLAIAAGATAAPILLYDGSGTPTSQGWTRINSGSSTQVVGVGTTTFSTSGEATNLYLYDTAATDFVVSIGLAVEASQFNPFDAGLMFTPFGSVSETFAMLAYEREHSLTIGQDTLLWGDNTGPTYSLNTGVTHEYALRYSGGKLDVFVDAVFANVVAGTATPILSRTGVVPGFGQNVGTVGFGDGSNDFFGGPSYVNSNYTVDFVQFEALPAAPPVSEVPEPATLSLTALGLGVGAFKRARRRS